MKIKIEMDEQAEEEVIIRCRGMTEQIAAIQRAVSEAAGAVQKIVLYKGNTEYYLPMNDICSLRQRIMEWRHTPEMICMRPDTSCMN